MDGNFQGPRWAREHTLLASAAHSVSGQSVIKNAGEYGEAIFFLDVTAISGSGATLEARLQYSSDNAEWFDSAHAFTPRTSTGKQALPVSVLGTYIRFDYTITGTTPSITFSLKGSFKS